MRHPNPLRTILFALALCFFLAGTATADDAPGALDATLEAAPATEVSNTDEALDPVDLLALLGDEGSQWLRPTSGGGSCYNCDSHSECDAFCGPLGGACLRDLDEVCDPGCPYPPCDPPNALPKYCNCF